MALVSVFGDDVVCGRERVSKKNGKSRAVSEIRELMRVTRKKIDKVARAAALWWLNTYGRRIKAGAVKEVIRSWNRGRLKPPGWLIQYASNGDRNLLFA